MPEEYRVPHCAYRHGEEPSDQCYACDYATTCWQEEDEFYGYDGGIPDIDPSDYEYDY